MNVDLSSLRDHVTGHEVFAFGFRGTGFRLKPYSDLDLAVSGKLTSRERLGSY